MIFDPQKAVSSTLEQSIKEAKLLCIKQVKEPLELLGFEGRNQYEICTEGGQCIAHAGERKEGFFKAIIRQLLRHWRPFHIDVYDQAQQRYLEIEHPFRFYFSKLTVASGRGVVIGSMEKKFTILSKQFEIDPSQGARITMKAGFFRIWKYPFLKNGKEVAYVHKKWGGVLKEAFLDADTFVVEFLDPHLTLTERTLLLSAALFIDVMYFDDNNGFNIFSFIPGAGD